MKIILAIVDELPKSASRCEASESHWDSLAMEKVVDCKLTLERVCMSQREYVTQRCPNCPLVEEADEVQE